MSDELFGPLGSTAEIRSAVSGRAWLEAMLDAEAALAAAGAAVGVVPAESATAIAAACRADRFDLAAIADEAVDGGAPVIALVRHLRAAVGGPHAAFVHAGATSQDILDTAMVLVVRRAWTLIDADAGSACEACAGLAGTHRHTLMAARTLLQQALPTTFGLKAAGWLVALVEARQGVVAVCRDRLAAQLGGAAGTLAAFGDHGLAVASAFAAELGLPEPTVPWHTARARVAELAGSLGVLAGVCDKIALDVGLLAQTEVGEAREGGGLGRGGSSTLPHKRNPVGVAAIRAARRRALGQVHVLQAAMAHEHERALGAWPAEWQPLSDLLTATAVAVRRTAELLAGLEIDPARMAENLRLTDGLVMAEAVASALAPMLGRPRAKELVEEASQRAVDHGSPLRDELLKSAEVAEALDSASIDSMLDPAGYLGATDDLIDRALQAYAESTQEEGP